MAMPDVQFPTPVLRVRVRRRGDEWTIEKQTRIPSMTLPRASELPETGGRALAGFWYEATDAAGRALYRRVIRDPTEQSVEVPGAGGGFARADADRPEVIFDVLIPELPEVTQLRFFASDPAPGFALQTPAKSRAPSATLDLERPRPPRSRTRKGT